MSVSIVTITQYTRRECLLVLSEMINRQTYQNIIEWIFVEGSTNEEEAILNREYIIQLISNRCSSGSIIQSHKYIEYNGLKIGGLRNLGNSACSGDIIVCMDDDDYYPPERVSESVDKLSGSSCLIGGTSDIYMYDFFIDKLYKFKGFGKFHSSNACMAYKKEYLLDNTYDSQIQVGEENSFTKDFTNPLVKFDAEKTIIASSHSFNTFNKREMCMACSNGFLDTLVEIDEPITNYIPLDIFTFMRNNFVKHEKSPYDVVYVVGFLSRKIDTKMVDDGLLTESEMFMIQYSEYLVHAKNKKVAIYGEFDLENDQSHNGVDYIHWKKFPYHHTHNIIVLSSEFGAMNILPFTINADQIIWDYHDHPLNDNIIIELWKKYKTKVSKVLLKSHYHLSEFEKYFGSLEIPYQIIPSGVCKDAFTNNWSGIQRDPYRFLYNSPYNRGAEYIIKHIFSIIKQTEPCAELHIYGDTSNNNIMGVCYHGIQPMKIISRAKHLSTFHIYISNIVNEIDAVNIRESIAAGCIPLTASFGVFLETESIKFDMDHNNVEKMRNIALQIIELMKNQEKLESIRNHFSSIETWEQVCDKIYNFV